MAWVAFALGVFAPQDIDDSTPAIVLAGMLVWFLLAYATYMCFAVYFTVTDLDARGSGWRSSSATALSWGSGAADCSTGWWSSSRW